MCNKWQPYVLWQWPNVVIDHSTGAGGNLTCPGLTSPGVASVAVGILIFPLCCMYCFCYFLRRVHFGDRCSVWCCYFFVVSFLGFVTVVFLNAFYVFSLDDYLSSSAKSTADGSICGNPALLFGLTIVSFPLAIIFCISCSLLIHIFCTSTGFQYLQGGISNFILIISPQKLLCHTILILYHK